MSALLLLLLLDADAAPPPPDWRKACMIRSSGSTSQATRKAVILGAVCNTPPFATYTASQRRRTAPGRDIRHCLNNMLLSLSFLNFHKHTGVTCKGRKEKEILSIDDTNISISCFVEDLFGSF